MANRATNASVTALTIVDTGEVTLIGQRKFPYDFPIGWDDHVDRTQSAPAAGRATNAAPTTRSV